MWPSGLTLAMTLTLNFQGQIWNFLYLSQKCSDCHEMKSEHMDWTQASNVTNGFDLGHNLDLWILKIKCDLDIWPYTWPWTWIFMVKFWNSCISEWEGRLTLHKVGHSRPLTMTIWWPRSGVWIYQIVTGGDFSCRRAVDSSSYFQWSFIISESTAIGCVGTLWEISKLCMYSQWFNKTLNLLNTVWNHLTFSTYMKLNSICDIIWIFVC